MSAPEPQLPVFGVCVDHHGHPDHRPECVPGRRHSDAFAARLNVSDVRADLAVRDARRDRRRRITSALAGPVYYAALVWFLFLPGLVASDPNRPITLATEVATMAAVLVFVWHAPRRQEGRR